jgi:hypothetical protein
MALQVRIRFSRAAWEDDEAVHSGTELSGVKIKCALEGKGKMAKTARITFCPNFVDPDCDEMQICYWIDLPDIRSSPFAINIGWGTAQLKPGGSCMNEVPLPKSMLEWIFENVGELKIDICVGVVLRDTSVGLLRDEAKSAGAKRKRLCPEA